MLLNKIGKKKKNKNCSFVWSIILIYSIPLIELINVVLFSKENSFADYLYFFYNVYSSCLATNVGVASTLFIICYDKKVLQPIISKRFVIVVLSLAFYLRYIFLIKDSILSVYDFILYSIVTILLVFLVIFDYISTTKKVETKMSDDLGPQDSEIIEKARDLGKTQVGEIEFNFGGKK